MNRLHSRLFSIPGKRFEILLPEDACLYRVEREDVAQARLWFGARCDPNTGDFVEPLVKVPLRAIAEGQELPGGVRWKYLGVVKPRGLTYLVFVQDAWVEAAHFI